MPAADTPPQDIDITATGERIERLLSELAAATDPAAARCGEQLVQTLVTLYGAGLARIVGLLDEPGEAPTDDPPLARLAADPLVSSLLLVHDLHPVSTEKRVRDALDSVRPYLGRHSGDVELLAVIDGVVQLRLAGNCHGCPSSEVTVRHAIEQAVTAAAPEVTDVTVEGVVAESAADSPQATAGADDRPGQLLQIQRQPPHPYAGAACPAASDEPETVRA